MTTLPEPLLEAARAGDDSLGRLLELYLRYLTLLGRVQTGQRLQGKVAIRAFGKKEVTRNHLYRKMDMISLQ